MSNFNHPYDPKEKLEALKLLKTKSYEYVAERYKCSIRTLYRWKKLYDGTIDSLKNGSHIPNSLNPRTMPEEEFDNLIELFKKYPYATDRKIAEMLVTNRNPVTIYRKRKKYFSDYKPKNKNDINCLFDNESIFFHNSKDFFTDEKSCYLLELSNKGLYVGRDTTWPVFFTPFYSMALKFYSYDEVNNFRKKINKSSNFKIKIKHLEK